MRERRGGETIYNKNFNMILLGTWAFVRGWKNSLKSKIGKEYVYTTEMIILHVFQKATLNRIL